MILNNLSLIINTVYFSVYISIFKNIFNVSIGSWAILAYIDVGCTYIILMYLIYTSPVVLNILVSQYTSTYWKYLRITQTKVEIK